MSTVLAPLFDYGVLDTATAEYLRERADKIHKLARITAQGIVLIGEYLSDAKERVGHGRFLDWIKQEFGWAERSARRFMEVHEAFKSAKLADLQIDVSALYLIAAPKTPEPVRTEVLRRAEEGERITHGAVIELRKRYEETGELPDTETGLLALAAEVRRERKETPLLSPSEARKEAIRIGKHVADSSGMWHPPVTEEQETEIRTDFAKIQLIEDFVEWFAAGSAPDPSSVLPILRRQHWVKLYLTDRDAIGRAAAWWVALAKEMDS